MAENKTQFTDANVLDFIHTIEDKQKREDSLALLEIMEKATGKKAKMYGPTIVGFGKYQYKYASGHSGEAPLLGFSPRKAAISLYVYTGAEKHWYLLDGLGKFKVGKACIYIKKLSDINFDVLQKLMDATVDFISTTYTRIH
jgi:hypothetical protein